MSAAAAPPSVGPACLFLDANGNIVGCTYGSEVLLGATNRALLGQHVAVCYSPEERAAGAPRHDLERAAADGRHERVGSWVRGDGHSLQVRTTVIAIRGGCGNVWAFLHLAERLCDAAATRAPGISGLDTTAVPAGAVRAALPADTAAQPANVPGERPKAALPSEPEAGATDAPAHVHAEARPTESSALEPDGESRRLAPVPDEVAQEHAALKRELLRLELRFQEQELALAVVEKKLTLRKRELTQAEEVLVAFDRLIAAAREQMVATAGNQSSGTSGETIGDWVRELDERWMRRQRTLDELYVVLRQHEQNLEKLASETIALRTRQFEGNEA